MSAISKLFQEAIMPDKDIAINEWADENRILPAVSSAEPGKYRTSRTPYLREIMEVLSPFNPIRQIKLIKATQIGATEVGNNFVLSSIDYYPAPTLMILPTIELAQKLSKQKITPSIEAMPGLKKKIGKSKSRESGNTILVKEFKGGILTLGGANAGTAFRSGSYKNVDLDDIDGFPSDVDGEGSPLALAKKRVDAFPDHKIYINSTPTVSGLSNIEKEYEDSDQRLYHVPCPYCGHYQPIRWKNIKFQRKQYNLISGTVFLKCEKCKKKIKEHHKTKMLAKGKWVAQNPGHPFWGGRLPAFYSPIGWVSWEQIAREFLEAKKALKRGDRSLMKVWVNTRLAETWKEDTKALNENTLFKRREEYKKQCPKGVLLITCSVDIQADRIEGEIKGWGEGNESWGIEYFIIYGDPESENLWKELNQKLLTKYKHELGVNLAISCTTIDSGYLPDYAYRFCKGKKHRKIFATKGSNQQGQPLISRPNRNNKYRVPLFMIGTDTAKERIFTRLEIHKAGPGYMHFPDSYDLEYFEQLTAEELQTKYKKGHPYNEWIKVRERNEALDITVGNLAALEILNPNFQKIKESFEIKVKEQGQTIENKKKTRTKKNWVNSWK